VNGWLVLSWALTLGWIPSGNVTLIKQEVQQKPIVLTLDKSGALVQNIELGLTAWNTVTIWTSIETFDTAESAVRYAPFRSDYTIGLRAGRTIGWATIEAGISHECIHPVLTGTGGGVRLFGGGDTVYVKVGGKIGD
jgi:hypothetical protein